jgi:hypothetical protein
MGEIGEWSRIMKTQKKAKKLAQPQQRRCWDWMIVSGTCNYAKNRSSFKTYRRIQGTAGGAPVIGIGTVELQVRRSPGSKETGPLLLENVLHIPSASCNGLNALGRPGRDVTFKGDLAQGFDRPGGQPMWYATTYCGLWRLALAGNPQGASYLREGGCYSLSIFMSDEERAKLFSSDTTTPEDTAPHAIFMTGI